MSLGSGLGLFACTAIFAGALALSHPSVTIRGDVGSQEKIPKSEEERQPQTFAQIPVAATSAADVGESAVTAEIAKCSGSTRKTCVVDGDTFWLEGAKIRIADIDTPEISKPQCPQELQLGQQATERLVALLNQGPFEVRSGDGPDQDRFGRKLRIIVRDGESLGETLISEGLAHRWGGHKEPWC